MPTYQNSAGNTGIARQYGEWRYFNSSLQRLGEYRGARLNVRVSPSMTQAKTNYWQALTGLLGTVGKTFEAYRDYSYQLADKYVDKHGIDSYNKAMVDNQVPIQNNPLAMERIKERQGQILSGIVNSDFNNRIENGEFVGKSPFAVEAAMIEAKLQAPEELSKYLPFDIANDYAFNEGYWGGSQKQRDQANLKNSSATSDRIKQQALINISGVVNGMVDQGYSVEDVFAKIKEFEETEGIYFDPSEKTKLYSSVLERGSLRPDGKEFLDYIANQTVPGTSGTFRDLYGDATFQTLKVKSDNAKLVDDATGYYNFLETINNLTDKPEGGVKLKQLLDQELRLNGNIKTDRTDSLYKAIGDWEKNQKTALKNAESSNAHGNGIKAATDYYLRYVQGEQGLPSEEFMKSKWKSEGLKVTDNDLKVAQQGAVLSILGSGDTKKINTMLNAITANGTPSELKSYTGDYLGNLFSSIDADINKYATERVLPKEATDGYSPIVSPNGKLLGYAPNNFNQLMSLYYNNPSAVRALFRGVDSNLDKMMKVSAMAIAMGKNPIEILGNAKRLDDDLDRQKELTGVERHFNYSLIASNIVGLEDNIDPTFLSDVNSTMSAIIKSDAYTYKSYDKSTRTNAALSKAKEQVQKELAGIGEFVVPINVLTSGFGNADLSDSSKEDVIEIANELFVELVKKQYPKATEADYGGSYYDAYRNRIRVTNLTGDLKAIIKMDEFAQEIRRRFDNR